MKPLDPTLDRAHPPLLTRVGAADWQSLPYSAAAARRELEALLAVVRAAKRAERTAPSVGLLRRLRPVVGCARAALPRGREEAVIRLLRILSARFDVALALRRFNAPVLPGTDAGERGAQLDAALERLERTRW